MSRTVSSIFYLFVFVGIQDFVSLYVIPPLKEYSFAIREGDSTLVPCPISLNLPTGAKICEIAWFKDGELILKNDHTAPPRNWFVSDPRFSLREDWSRSIYSSTRLRINETVYSDHDGTYFCSVIMCKGAWRNTVTSPFNRKVTILRTKFHAIIFDPPVPQMGKKLCLKANYSMDTNSPLRIFSLKRTNLYTLNISGYDITWNDSDRYVFYYSSPSGNMTYFGERDLDLNANTINHDYFCIKKIHPFYNNSEFLWSLEDSHENIYSQRIKFKFHNYRKSGTKINSVHFDHDPPVYGEPYCIIVNYTIDISARLYALELQILGPSPITIYRFLRGRGRLYVDPPAYWIQNEHRTSMKLNRYCFKQLDTCDSDFQYRWVIWDSKYYMATYDFNITYDNNLAVEEVTSNYENDLDP